MELEQMETSQSTTAAETIFVVDDDGCLRRGLARLLRSAGWNVEAFCSARHFVERPAYAGTGCVVLDVRMPGMTGPELHDWMATHGVRLPVIFLTGHGDVPTGVQAIKKGAVDFLLKPVDEVALMRAIEQAIERHAAEQIYQRQRQEIEIRLSRLSLRERQVMWCVIGGHLNKQTADKMGISIKTVKVHRAHVMEKMEVDSVAALVHSCEMVGILDSQSGA